MAKTKWQHKDPQGDHVVVLAPTKVRGVSVCQTCHRPIVEVDENEGPESLKRLLRF